MQGSKKTAARVIVFLIIFVLLNTFFNFLLIPPQLYSRPVNYERQTMDGKIDTLFLGASHVVRGFSPKDYDDVAGTFSFNAGTSAQSVRGSYFYLKDMLKSNDIKTVIFDPFYPKFNSGFKTDVMSDILVLDRLRDAAVSVEFFFTAIRPNDYLSALSKAHLYRSRFNIGSLKKTLTQKLSAPYRNHDANSVKAKDEHYGQRGFVYSENILPTEGDGAHRMVDWQGSEINRKQESYIYLIKMIEMCKQKGVEFIMVTVPVPNAYIENGPPYGDIYSFFADIAKERGIGFYDFNLSKYKAENFTNADYMDFHHLNGKGAIKFTRYCASVIKQLHEGKDASTLFFDADNN